MTEKLFYKDSFTKSFHATVISCEPNGDRYQAVLDRTAFFPEGGGQYADTGKLGEVNVLDVQEKDGQVLHYIDAPLTVGEEVYGEIDWKLRFSRMQQHTGEHVVTGLIHNKYGYDNVGFHVNDEICTLDMNGPLTKEQLFEIETLANEAIHADVPVNVLYPTKEELETLEYRSKIEILGQVRIISIPGYDVCACCAPHLHSTGEIGMIKIVNTMNYKGGVRINIACGDRALADYRKKEEIVKNIMFELSSKEELVAEAVKRMKEDNQMLKLKLEKAQKDMLGFKAAGIEEGQPKVCLFESELSGNGPRELMNMVLDRNTEICAVFCGTDEDGYRYVIGSRSADVRALGKKINEAFQGKGGGKPDMIQGSLKGNKEQILATFMED